MEPNKLLNNNKISVQEAISLLHSGDRILVPMLASVPGYLLDGLCEYGDCLENVTVIGNSFLEDLKILSPEYNDRFRVRTMFYMPPERTAIAKGRHFDKEIVQLSSYYRNKMMRNSPNVAFIMVSTPDEHGNVSLGPAPSDLAEHLPEIPLVIAQMNSKLPFAPGKSSCVNIADIDYFVEHTSEPAEISSSVPTAVDKRIAAFIAERIADGSCVQLGIGGVPAAVGQFLKDKRDLGIHTEMMGDSFLDLIECGAVNNSKKCVDTGLSVYGACMGTKRLYSFLNYNFNTLRKPFYEVNDPYVIAKNDKMVSINGAIAMDVTGQCCAENVGFRHYSGTGGHLDFARGAQLSKDGQSFIAFHSTYKDSEGIKRSKITTVLPVGSAVTTPRTDIQFVVTEYGVANIQYETIENRVKSLIAIADPDFRDELLFEAKMNGLLI